MIQGLEQKILAIIQHHWPEIKDEDITVDLKPADAGRGDLATSVSFAIAKAIRQTPQSVAEKIAIGFKDELQLVAKPQAVNGFINITITEPELVKICDEILKDWLDYGQLTIGKGQKARVEFISANPTGPLHIGNARGGPLGDAIANVLQRVGYQVLREYYHNDVGNQVIQLGTSILRVAQGEPLSHQEYRGEYIKSLAKQFGADKDESSAVGAKAVATILQASLQTAQVMGITFDKIYSENEFVQSGQTKVILDRLKAKGLLKKQAGAVWFAPKDEFLKDRESVVIKSDGQYPYFANDIAYHNLKFSEGYDRVVDVLGPDHHGHVPRLQAAITALGYNLTKFQAILYQNVRIRQGDKNVEMSKRTGNFVTAKEVLEEVGMDAFRFFMLMHDANTPIDFDLELAKKRSQDNPVYYVQYAAVRAKAIIRKSQTPNPKLQTKFKHQTPNTKLESSERRLIVHLAKLPSLIEEISQTFRVHLLTIYAIDTARLFHNFYEQMPVIEKEVVHEPRLKIVKATLVVLENTLKLLGVSVPDRM